MEPDDSGCMLRDRLGEEEARTGQEVEQAGEREKRDRQVEPGRGKEPGTGGGHSLMKGLLEK